MFLYIILKNKKQKIVIAMFLIAVICTTLFASSAFYWVPFTERTNKKSTSVHPMAFMAMSQNRKKIALFEPSLIIKNQTSPTSIYRVVNEYGKYFVVTRALVINDSKIIKYVSLPEQLMLPDIGEMEKVDKSSTSAQSIGYNKNDARQVQLASSSIEVTCYAPLSWERNTTIKTTVYIQNTGFFTFSFNGYISVIIQDEYVERGGGHEHYIHTDTYADVPANFTLHRFGFYICDIYVHIPADTPVGLKSIVVTLGSQPCTGATFNMGYQFVQKYYHTELDNYREEPYKNWLSYYPSPDIGDISHQLILNECETGDLGEGPLWHPADLDVIKFAGKAGDAPYIDTTVYEVGKNATSWVYQHFIYYDHTLVHNGKEYNFVDYTYTDLQQIDLYYEMGTGYFYGVCDEYATMFVSFMRALNIPARQLFLYAVFYHDIAEVWVGNTWIHSDPTKGIYDDPTNTFYNNLAIYSIYVVITALDRNNDGLYNSSFYYNLWCHDQIGLERLVAKYTGPNDYPHSH